MLPVLVDLELVTGRLVRSTLFLSMTSASRAGPETIDEFLNSERRVMPVRNGEKDELTSRDAIVSVRVVSDIAPRQEPAAPPAVDLVHVELASGKTLDGAVQHPQAERLSDFFNAAPQFFAVEDSGGIVFVNKRHVVAIKF